MRKHNETQSIRERIRHLAITEDIYYKKTLKFRAWKQEFLFRVSQDLFSSFDIDKGTRLLLRTVLEAGYEYDSVLDMGCGYGPLGLTVKKLRPGTAVTLADRDALAVAYARQNAVLNGIEGAEVVGSLGYDDLPPYHYDLILSNIPGKAGPPVISYLLREAAYHLMSGGIAAVVVVSPIAELVRQTLVSCGATIIKEFTRSDHAIFHYRFSGVLERRPELSSFERGIYDRQSIDIKYDGTDYSLKTVYGLPEFDSLHYATGLLVNALAEVDVRKGWRVAMLNPGQGHAAVYIGKLLAPSAIVLMDRDILALRTARRNLVINGYPGEGIEIQHRAGWGNNRQVDIICGVIREDEGQQVYLKLLDDILADLAAGGFYVAAGTSTAITRLVTQVEEKSLNAVVKGRKKSKGYSSVVLEKLP